MPRFKHFMTSRDIHTAHWLPVWQRQMTQPFTSVHMCWNCRVRSGTTSFSIFRQNYCDVTMGGVASQITSHTIVYSTGHSGPDQRKHQSSASLAFVRGIHRWPVNSPHKGPVTRKMFPFDDVIMTSQIRRDIHLAAIRFLAIKLF